MRHFWFKLITVLSLVFSSPAFALEEGKVFQTVVPLYSEDAPCSPEFAEPFWARKSVANPADDYVVRYSRFSCVIGDSGAILIAPGRTEPAYEYLETALDFIALGYGPIYAVDHRGQGLSPRMLKDPLKGHVARFEDYISDLDVVVSAMQADLSALGAPADYPRFFTSNSLGGAIGIGYFQTNGAETPFAAAALLGPMIHVNYISFVDTDATWLALRTFSEFGANSQANLRCGVLSWFNTEKCAEYANEADFGPYVTGSRSFVPDTESIMTHSRTRYDLRTHMWDAFDWAKIAAEEYAEGEFWTGPQLGGSTNGWVKEASRFNRQMRKSKNLEKMPDMPVLLMTGTRDLRAYRQFRSGSGKEPDLKRHSDFCDDMNAESLVTFGNYNCLFIPIKGAFHELYKERDAERSVAISAVDWFFRMSTRLPR
ncbi:serine aminopeptidase domain-containing protein [Actibacterium pelagium]|uniref:Lysophospholipase L2 n=1 Tax=Actibacterium pelagium TaxID=2029103 RepID=A0A917EJ77_9RHOB|nr:alpha/beta hydrolase [Actibacterium pelagium]GGE49871.1 lysophospholipase L2 [Actibacterium pelagium]